VASASTVLAGALINRQAVVNYVLDLKPATLWIVGSGWEGSFSLEDTVCAGAIASSLITQLGCSLEDIEANDEVIGAIALYHQWQDQLLQLFHHASHGQRLLRLNCHADLEYCSKTDILNLVPVQQEPGVLMAEKHLAALY
jgi:2-phosphosulfolactate phosphatase